MRKLKTLAIRKLLATLLTAGSALLPVVTPISLLGIISTSELSSCSCPPTLDKLIQGLFNPIVNALNKFFGRNYGCTQFCKIKFVFDGLPGVACNAEAKLSAGISITKNGSTTELLAQGTHLTMGSDGSATASLENCLSISDTGYVASGSSYLAYDFYAHDPTNCTGNAGGGCDEYIGSLTPDEASNPGFDPSDCSIVFHIKPILYFQCVQCPC